jgi:hypothetical protein
LDSRFAKKLVSPAKRFQGGRGGLSGHARVGRHREWRRTHLGGSPLSAPQQREGRVLCAHGRRGGRPRSLAAQSGQ